MNFIDIIKSIFVEEVFRQNYSGKVIGEYFGNIYTTIPDWMIDNSVYVYHFNDLLLTKRLFANISVTMKTENSLYLENDLKIDSLIISKGSCNSVGSVRKCWERFIKGESHSKRKRLEVAVLITSVIAWRLKLNSGKYIMSFIEMYSKALSCLKINLSNEQLAALIPFNYTEAYDEWNNSLYFNTMKNVRITYRKQVLKEKEYSVSIYDFFCMTLYLAIWKIENFVIVSKDRDKIIQNLENILINIGGHIDLAATKYQNREMNRVIKDFFENCGSDQIRLSDNPSISFECDPKFKHHSNLYYSIDMQALEYVLRNVTKESIAVLDLGCGTGDVTLSRFKNISSARVIIGIDIDQNSVDLAREKANHMLMDSRFSFYQKDFNSNTFFDDLSEIMKKHQIEFFDIIIATAALNFSDNPSYLLREIKDNILLPNGWIIIREVADETKVCYSRLVPNEDLIRNIAEKYRKAFGVTERNAAKKMFSWMINQGFSVDRVLYEVVDTVNKSEATKEDIYNVTIGFRKVRAQKKIKILKENGAFPEQIKECQEVIESADDFAELFHNPDFWYAFTNYIAIGHSIPANSYKRMKAPVNNLVHFNEDNEIEIYFVRHAECNQFESFGEVSYVINASGKLQIKKLEKYFQNVDFDEVICSDKERCSLTAESIAYSHNIKLSIFPEINEINRGDIQNDHMWISKGYEEYYQIWRDHRADIPFPEGETGIETWLRAKYVIDRVIENATLKKRNRYRVAIVSHGETIRCMICGILGIPQQYRYQIAENIDYCSISIVKLKGNQLNTSIPGTLECINYKEHLV